MLAISEKGVYPVTAAVVASPVVESKLLAVVENGGE
jgi:hypothetical protein